MNLTIASQNALQGHLQSLMAGKYAVRAPQDLTRAVEAVSQRFGNGQSGLVTKDRVEAAVIALRVNPELGGRQLFVLAHALAQPLLVLRGCTALQDEIGAQLLSHWEDAAKRGQLKSSHWRGLFRSYMQAEKSEACQRLRELLVGTLKSLGRDRSSTPLWLSAVRRHSGLLGAAPCAPYVEELIEGESSRLDDLSREVSLPDASWFWVGLRDAALEQIEASSESKFRKRISHLVSLPDRIPNSRDEILAALISRYARCNDRARHLQLMEFALDAWGSPQLKSNRLWGLVNDGARQMVCGWLAQEDLEDFYRLCRGTRQVDDRRLKFWLRFKEQMGYTQILLGGQFRYSRDSDTREFIRKKKGRVGELTSGPATNNAILMQIGGWLFVEFSETGHACYAYPSGEAAIELGRKSYPLSQLKPSAKSLRRLLHMDGNEKWEQKFLASLHQIGVQPDVCMPAGTRHVARASGVTPASAVPAGAHTTNRPSGGASASSDAADMLLASLSKMNVRVVDHRAKGGAIWAYPNSGAFPYLELRALGMKFKSDNQGFYWP